jgi:beta-galactosidase
LTLVRGFNGRMMIVEQLSGPAGQTYMLRSPRPGEVRLWAMQAVAHGAEGMVHFRWRSARRGAEEYWFGVLDHDNVPRARFAEFKQEGLELQQIGPQVLGAKVVSEIAAIKDFEAEWVFEHQFLTKEISAGAVFRALFQAASEQRHNIDFVSPAADLGGYKLVFAPQTVLMDDALAGKLKRFVEGGGALVMSAHSALKDRDNAFTAGTIPVGLTDLFGAELDSFQTYQPPSSDRNAVRFDEGTTVPIHVFAEVLRPTTARVVAQWDRDYLKGKPAVTERQIGKGKAVYYGSLFNVEAGRQLLKRYAGELGLKPLLPDIPEQVEVTRRTKGERDYYFLLNHGDTPATINPGDGFSDLLGGQAVPASLALAPFDCRVITRARR